MSYPDHFRDFDDLKRNVRSNTVDRLKAIITGFGTECGMAISKYGKKQDLIDRIVDAMVNWKSSGNVEKFEKARGIVLQVRSTGSYSGFVPSPVGGAPKPIANRLPPPPAFPATGSTGLGGTGASSRSSTSSTISFRPKPSPFFSNEQPVSQVIECPESQGPQDRRQQYLNFSLSQEHVAKLKLQTPDPQWQLRLYCTSSSFFSLGTNAYRFTNQPCPIEFPPTCEIRVNNSQLSANTKGLKKKPGTAPPPDLTKAVHLTAGTSNRIDLIYVNSQQGSNQQPATPKKYYMVVMLVQYTTTEQLIERLKKGKYVSGATIRTERLKKAAEDDDDIVAGPSKISLKCPLSYVRISIPCRSSQCVHPSCFDALSWYSVNEQTTTWSCPVCEKGINHEELVVDGTLSYFDEILKATPEDVEDVMVEADCEWHTSDGEHASAAWKAAHPLAHPLAPPPPVATGVGINSPASSATVVNDITSKRDKSSAAPEVEVFVLDSDDDDEGQVKRQLSPTGHPPSSLGSLGGSHPPGSQIIDLTLDSDDEVPPPLPTPTNGKRGAPDDEPGVVSKRLRTEELFSSGKVAASYSPGSSSNSGASPYMNNRLYFSQRMNDPAYRLPPPEPLLSRLSPLSVIVGNRPVRYGTGSPSSPSLPQPDGKPLPPTGPYSTYPPQYPPHEDWP